MKPVPFCGALALLYTSLTPCLAQDLQPHQEAANQIDACLTLADGRIIALSERLRELKIQRQRLSTVEDALSKVTLQKSRLEAQLAEATSADSANAELEHALSDAQRTSNAYREETERLRQDVIRLSQETQTAAANKERISVIEQEHADALRLLESERKAAEALKLARASSDSRLESTTQELTTLRQRLNLAEETAKQLAPLRDQIKTTEQQQAETEKARLRQVEQATALTKQLEQAQTELASYKQTREQQLQELSQTKNALERTEELLAQANAGKDAETSELAKQLTQTAQALTDSEAALNLIVDERASTEAQLSELQKALEEERAKAALASELEQKVALSEATERELARALEEATIKHASFLSEQQTKDAKMSDTAKALEQERAKAERAAELEKQLAAALAKQQEAERALKQAQAERSGILNSQSANDAKLADALKALEAERTKAARASELEKELAALRAKAAQEQAALANLQKATKESEARIASLTLAQTEQSDEVTQSIKDLEKRLAARDVELSNLKVGLTQKEDAWQQERINFLTSQKKLQAEIASAKQAQTVMQGDFLQIDPIRYELNSSQIDDEQARVLGQAQKILKIYPKASFEISGHTCTLGSDARNQTLSEQRAKRLLDFLASNGVSPSQLSSTGFGETKPLADNSTDAGRRKNRRVEIRVKSADGTTLLDTEDRR